MSDARKPTPPEYTPGTREFEAAAEGHRKEEERRRRMLERQFGSEYASRRRCTCMWCMAGLPDNASLAPMPLPGPGDPVGGQP